MKVNRPRSIDGGECGVVHVLPICVLQCDNQPVTPWAGFVSLKSSGGGIGSLTITHT